MENSFDNHVLEWKEMNKQGRFIEARHFYFEKLFQEVIDQFVQRTKWQRKPVDVLFSLLGYTPEPIILAEKVLNPRKHVILHDREVTTTCAIYPDSSTKVLRGSNCPTSHSHRYTRL